MGGLEITSPEFVEKIREREPAAIERVVRSFTSHLHNAALGMGFDPETAEELAQDVCITFYDKAPGFEGRAHVRTFLFAILNNKAMEKRREYAKMQKHDPIDDVVSARFDKRGHWIGSPISPEEFALSAENAEILRQCVDSLPLSQRSAFMMKEVEGLKGEEICNVLEVSATNLGVLLFRARNRLRECIEGKHLKRK
ncbi:MAG: sigma-70 family RNA polymerase sigma factor [Nitrospinae bacterium]|nr:sigma-70 family RNA polymerase sigma factor [Nitrospinota bacterium]